MTITHTLPHLTKRIGEYDRYAKDYPAFVIHEDGHEEYIGSRPTQHDASLLASDFIISYYRDHHTPEVAAELVMAEAITEGRHEQLARDMGAEWESIPAIEEALDRVIREHGSIRLAIGGDPEAVTLVEPDAYQAMVAADDAWQAELERLFGRNAGDVRYTEEGRTGPALAPLYAEYRRTCAAWHDAQMSPALPIDTCTICGGTHRPTQCPRMAHAPIYVCPSCDDLTLSCGLCPACTETGETLPATQPTGATIAAAA